MTSSRSSYTAPWPIPAGWIRRSIPTIAPRHVLPGRSSGGERLPRRPGPVLHAAQLALAVELRRRQRRRRDCGPDIAVPVLVVGNLADDACTPSHTRRLFEAIGHPDKEMHEIAGANHYYAGPDQRDTPARSGRHLHGLAAQRRVLTVNALTGPLDGIRVIEVGTLIAGPFAGRLLGDMGAEVIKIEPPGAPDPLRTWGQAELDGHHFFWTVHARNKKAVTLEPARGQGPRALPRPGRALRHHRRELPAGHAGEVGSRLRRSARTQSGHHPGAGVRLRADRAGGAQGRLRLGRRGRQRAAAHERLPRRPSPAAGAVARRQPGRHVRRAGRPRRALPAHGHRRGPDRRRRADRSPVWPSRNPPSPTTTSAAWSAARPAPGWRASRRRTSTRPPTAAGWSSPPTRTPCSAGCAARWASPSWPPTTGSSITSARGRNQDEIDKIIGAWAAERQPADIIATLGAAGVISGPDQHRRRGRHRSAAAGHAA